MYFCATVSGYSHCVHGSNNGNSTFRRGKIRTKRARWSDFTMIVICLGPQYTNSSGQVLFAGIYSGWYINRTTLVDFKVEVNSTYSNSTDTYSSRSLTYTGR